MVEAERVANLVEQDGEEVDALGGRTVGRHQTVACEQIELGAVARRRVDEPTDPGGVGVDLDQRAGDPGECAVLEIGDGEGELRQDRRVGAAGPLSEGLLNEGGKLCLGEIRSAGIGAIRGGVEMQILRLCALFSRAIPLIFAGFIGASSDKPGVRIVSFFVVFQCIRDRSRGAGRLVTRKIRHGTANRVLPCMGHIFQPRQRRFQQLLHLNGSQETTGMKLFRCRFQLRCSLFARRFGHRFERCHVRLMRPILGPGHIALRAFLGIVIGCQFVLLMQVIDGLNEGGEPFDRVDLMCGCCNTGQFAEHRVRREQKPRLESLDAVIFLAVKGVIGFVEGGVIGQTDSILHVGAGPTQEFRHTGQAK